MSKFTREEKLFKKEIQILTDYRRIAEEDTSPEETKAALQDLTEKYKSLLEQTRFLTWISGRLERKMHRINRELFQKNIKLENTLADLTKSEASRSATGIIYFIAIVLFVLEEYFVEPVIAMFGEGETYSGILIKVMIVLLLKLSEGFIERKLTKRKINANQFDVAMQT
jgi:hypothetical protein